MMTADGPQSIGSLRAASPSRRWPLTPGDLEGEAGRIEEGEREESWTYRNSSVILVCNKVKGESGYT